MDRMVFLAASAAKQTAEAQTVNAHNLANVSTAGFRADLETAITRALHGPGHADRAFISATDLGSFDAAQGPQTYTGQDLDVAVQGPGWMVIQAPDGGEAFTRAGDFRVDESGLLVNGSGYPVMGNQGPITVPPHEKIEIGADGTISVQPLGQDINSLVILDRILLANPDSALLEKGPDGLIRTSDGSAAIGDAAVSLASGQIEGSNVNGVDAMVRMIELQRQYEAQINLMTTAEENDQSTSRLMRMR